MRNIPLVDCSPSGWKASQNYDGLFTLWIPYNRLDDELYEDFKEWACLSQTHLWLGTNKNTRNSFRGDEINYCMASDWNFDFGTQRRTAVGEAEYQLKYNYPKHLLTTEDAKQYSNELASAVLGCMECLPFDFRLFCVCAIPAVKQKQGKLAWQLTEHIAKTVGAPFVKVSLSIDKPQMKNLSIGQKVATWRNIYSNDSMIQIPNSLSGESVLIIDDLYQSGASVWCFAEYLKNHCGVKTVIAISSVKALNDGDNT